MKHTTLGRTGLPVSRLCLGTMTFGPQCDEATSHAILDHALELGISFIDTADLYPASGPDSVGETERIIGRWMQGRRDDVVVATKFFGPTGPAPWHQGASRRHIMDAVEGSLRRLQTDVIDLYQIHRPDLFTHPADVAITLTALRAEGKIREVGVSNHTPAQVSALQAHLEFPIASNQPEFSALHLDPMRDGTFDLCMEYRIAPMAWSPLAGGRLATGDDCPPELLAVLDSLADREGVDRSQVALAFVLAHPSAPIAIIGTQRPERIASSNAALGVALTRDDVYAIVQASEGVPLP